MPHRCKVGQASQTPTASGARWCFGLCAWEEGFEEVVLNLCRWAEPREPNARPEGYCVTPGRVAMLDSFGCGLFDLTGRPLERVPRGVVPFATHARRRTAGIHRDARKADRSPSRGCGSHRSLGEQAQCSPAPGGTGGRCPDRLRSRCTDPT